MTTGTSIQRIYIGGIDPQRLTIDDVSSRLRRLVDVVSIETPASKPSDDCFVNTGPSFFYLNARCPPAEEDAAENDTAESAATPAKASPLQVLSKAYNNVKWKGCTLRVEEARPHFLDRLRLEREERERKERQEMEEGQQSEDAKASDNENQSATEEAAPSVANLPRNLRIRRRHGEEAFKVDTKPIDVGSTAVDDTNAHGGNKWKSRAESNHRNARRSASETQWENFGTALDKLRRKRAKHADQYAEQKRRLKRQAKGRGPKGGIDDDSIEDVGSLNAKVFLNRAVHVRFDEDAENDAAFKADDISSSKRKDENNSNNARYEVMVEESSIGDESSTTSSDSDSSDDGRNLDDAEAKNDYTWSDDDGDDESSADEANKGLADKTNIDEEDASSDDLDDGSVVSNDGPSTKALVDTKKEEQTKAVPTAGGYAWSDDDSSDDDSSDDEDTHQPIRGPRDMGRSFSSLKPVDYDKPDGCKECSGPTDYDEFSSAVDFTGGDVFNDSQDGEEEDAPITNNNGGEDYQLDNDVSANLNVLGQLFPDMARIKANQPSAPDEDGEANTQADGFTPQVSRPGWGVTGLMQRYDPNDSKSAKFEVEVSDTKRESEVKEAAGDEISDSGSDAEEEEAADGSNDLSANASTSSEDTDDTDVESEGDNENVKEDTKKESGADDQMEIDKEVGAEDRDVDDKKEVYEQDKLEGIFQEARTGGVSGGFQMSQLFGDLGSAQQPEPESNTKESASGFSFGFNVGGGDNGKADDPPAAMAIGGKSASGFSFSFSMPAGTDEQGSDAKDVVQPGHGQIDGSMGSLRAPPSKEPEVKLKRRRGLLLPEDVLDELEQSFFHMNEGKQILEDYESMKADPESQSAWQEERKTLTLDWKRKQKFALSQKQKRRKS